MKPHRNRQRSRRFHATVAHAAVAGACVALAAATLPFAAHAQQSLPGLVVTAPPPLPGMAAPQAPPPQAPPPPAAVPPQTAKPPVASKPRKTRKTRRQAKPKAATGTKAASAAALGAAGASQGSGGGIALVVNGEPITGYDINQRAHLMGLQAGIGQRAQENFKRLVKTKEVTEKWKQIVQATIQAHQATKTREQIIAIIQQKQREFAKSLQAQAVGSARASVIGGLKSKARQELIEEAVKRQAARRENVNVDEAAVNNIIQQLAARNKMTPQQFATHFGNLGVDFASFKSRFRTQHAWVEVVRKKYGYLANPNNRDIDKLLQKEAAGESQLDVKVHRILIPVPAKMDQRVMASRVAEAENLQRQFRNCRSTSVLASKVKGARFEDLGTRKAATFSEPTCTFIQNAKDNEMLPPSVTSGGIELLAVCERNIVDAAKSKRAEKAAELRQEEFERLSRKYLRDLMADAVIEKR